MFPLLYKYKDGYYIFRVGGIRMVVYISLKE